MSVCLNTIILILIPILMLRKPYVEVVLIIFGVYLPIYLSPQESRVSKCLPRFGSGMGVLLAVRLFYLKSGRLDPNLLIELRLRC